MEDNTSKTNEQEELSTNPFAALFPNIQAANDFAKTFKATLEDELNTTNTSDKQGQDSGRRVVPQKRSRELSLEDKKKIANDFLQRSFLLSVNPGNTINTVIIYIHPFYHLLKI